MQADGKLMQISTWNATSPADEKTACSASVPAKLGKNLPL
jgi:hypothetical protein